MNTKEMSAGGAAAGRAVDASHEFQRLFVLLYTSLCPE